MAKLRKMLGSATAPGIVALMRQMETQSVKTLTNWCIDYALERALPVYEARSQDGRIRAELELAKKVAMGEVKLKDAKPILKEGREAARAEQDPVAQAAARACDAAAMSVQTITGALGMTFYAAAAIVYARDGLKETPAAYDALAEAEFEKMLESLISVSVENEENPAKIDWGC